MRTLLILRPEPGATASAISARARGLDALICPLFTIEPLAWAVPDLARFDALLVTSANALRHGGPGLEALVALPVLAVGETTAAAARAAGFKVAAIGSGGVAALLAERPSQRLLHLAGEDRVDPPATQPIHTLSVYRAAAIPAPALPDPANLVALVHSARAGARLAELVRDRSGTAIAAISEAAAAACGSGWQSLDWPEAPGEAALLELAARLCQSPPR